MITEELQRHNVLVVQASNHLKVTFPQTKITEYWYLGAKPAKKQRSFHIPITGPFFVGPIPTYQQYQTNLFCPEDNTELEKYFLIRKKDIAVAGWCDIRLKVHELTAQLATEGWKDITYPYHITQQEVKNLRDEDLSTYQSSLIRYLVSDRKDFPGRSLIYSLTPYLKDCGIDHLWTMKSLYYHINKLFSKPRNITRIRVIRSLLNRHGTSLAAPGFWRAILSRWLDVRGQGVLDLDPDLSKLVAVSLEGGSYDSVNGALLMPLYNILNAPAPVEDPRVVILSRHIPLDGQEAISRIHNYLHNRSGLVLVKKDHLGKVTGFRKPSQILRISTHVGTTANDDNCLLIYRQK
jgi:hypothetical protein